jgi:DNA-binding transcriptional MocR family regulator
MQRAMSFKAGGGVNQFAALAIEEYLRHHDDQHIVEQNQALRVKRDAMLAALGENFGGTARWTAPEGGLYVWVEFPEGTDLASVQDRIFEEGVGYYNGAMFSPEGRGANCARLCFGHPDVQTIAAGVAEWARLLAKHGVIRG